MEVDHEATGVIGPRCDVPFPKLWLAMVDKIKRPEVYLQGVKSVTSHDNEDGSVFRDMHLANGMHMVENIYTFEHRKRIEFRVVDKPIVVVNQYRDTEAAIEYVVESREGQVLGWMTGMRASTMDAIKGQYEKARDM